MRVHAERTGSEKIGIRPNFGDLWVCVRSITTFAVPNRIDCATKHIHTTMTCLFLLALPHFFFCLALSLHFHFIISFLLVWSANCLWFYEIFHSCSSARLRLITTVRWISQFEIWAKTKRPVQYHCKVTAFGKCISTFCEPLSHCNKRARATAIGESDKKNHAHFRLKHRKLHFIWNGFVFEREKCLNVAMKRYDNVYAPSQSKRRHKKCSQRTHLT